MQQKNEDTMTVRRTNAANDLSKIKELLQKISSTRHENDKIQQVVEHNEAKACELTTELSVMKKEFESETKNLERKMREAEEQNNILRALKEEKDQNELSLVDLSAKHKTLKNTKPSTKDLQLLENGKRKLKLYKEFTGVRWDYSAPKNVFEGFITNKKDFLQKITFKGDIDYKTLREILWKDIYKSTLPPNSIMREECKENVEINK